MGSYVSFASPRKTSHPDAELVLQRITKFSNTLSSPECVMSRFLQCGWLLPVSTACFALDTYCQCAFFTSVNFIMAILVIIGLTEEIGFSHCCSLQIISQFCIGKVLSGSQTSSLLKVLIWSRLYRLQRDIRGSEFVSWSDYKTSVFNLWCRLHWRILHGSLPIWLQIKWLVQLEPLQLFLWDRDESQIQMAEGEALQWRSPLPKAGSQESGECEITNRNLSVLVAVLIGITRLVLQLQIGVISGVWLCFEFHGQS